MENRGGAQASIADPSQTIHLIESGEIKGDTYGCRAYKLYEAASPRTDPIATPILFVWLHGQNASDITTTELQRMHRYFERRAFGARLRSAPSERAFGACKKSNSAYCSPHMRFPHIARHTCVCVLRGDTSVL